MLATSARRSEVAAVTGWRFAKMIQRKGDAERSVSPYEVAQLVCLHGYTATTIARKLFQKQYERGEQAQAIMKTKRLLQRAVREGLIQLFPPRNSYLSDELKQRYPLMKSFTVVDDEAVRGFITKDSPVFVAAARLIAERIKQLVKEAPATKKHIVVANAGGVTLSRVIAHLGAVAQIPDGSERLRFISLNGARRADAYHVSANYLAVQMGQIYGGDHIAVINVRSPHIDARYRDALENVDLVLTSTGTRKSFLFLWPEEELEGGYPKIDDAAVGDISFVLIDAEGREVDLDDDFREEVRTHLRPQPSHGELVHLARQGKVFVVSAQLPPLLQQDHEEADYGPRARALVAHAVATQGLASDCVLGSTVAEILVEEGGLAAAAQGVRPDGARRQESAQGQEGHGRPRRREGDTRR